MLSRYNQDKREMLTMPELVRTNNVSSGEHSCLVLSDLENVCKFSRYRSSGYIRSPQRRSSCSRSAVHGYVSDDGLC